MATPGLVTKPGQSTPVWDVNGDGSGGYLPAVAVVAPGTGKLVSIGGRWVWDVAGDGTQGYIDAVVIVS